MASGAPAAAARAFRPTAAAAALVNSTPPGAAVSAQQPAAAAAAASGAPLRVVSYNILADRYSGVHGSYCPPEALAWAARWPRLRAELAGYAADVYLLQEVERPALESQIAPALGSGYGALYVPKPLPPGAAGPEEGVALLYRRASLTLLASASLRFHDLVASVLKGSSSGRSSGGGGNGGGGNGGGSSSSAALGALAALARRGRGEGAVCALLRHEASGREFVAACTHLFWDPNFPDVKLYQAAALCRGVADFLDSVAGPGAAARTPLVIGGDFNSLPVKHASDAFDTVPPGGGPLVSGVYELLTRGRVGPTHQDHPARRRAAAGLDGSAFGRVAFDTAGLALRSMHAQALGSEPPLTTRTSTFEGVLDYLFLSEGHWDVPAVLEMPYAHDSSGGSGGGSGGSGGGPSEAPSHAAFPPAPNEVWPSDHFAVGADLLLCV